MRKFVESNDNMTFSINFSSLERSTMRTSIYLYITAQLKNKEIDYDEGIELEKIAKKFNDRLLLGIIGNKNKDSKIDLTVDDIRRLVIVTIDEIDNLKEKNDELIKEIDLLEINGAEKYTIIQKNAQLIVQSENYIENIKLNEKLFKIMKNNSVYFFADG